jgi:hypothetical protein
MAGKDNKLTLPVELTISKDAYEKIAAVKKTDGGNLALALSIMCAQFLDQFANGGIMVKPENLKKIEEAVGSPVANDTDLLEVIQKSAGREEGQYTIKVNVEPALWPAIAEHAQVIGMTPEEVMTDMAMRMIRDSLAFYVNNQTYEPVVYLTEKDGRKLEKLLGKKKFSGADILSLIKQQDTAGVAA